MATSEQSSLKVFVWKPPHAHHHAAVIPLFSFSSLALHRKAEQLCSLWHQGQWSDVNACAQL
jgi:hypothetical protein